MVWRNQPSWVLILWIFNQICTKKFYIAHFFISKNVGDSLDSFFKTSWLHAWNFLDHLELYNTIYKKKVVNRKKSENDSIYKIVNNLFMELKNANPNGCNVVINNLHLVFLLLIQNIENWVK